jgi:L-2-hydroxyglutarate oxidase LhgO
MQALLADAERFGAHLVLCSEVIAGEMTRNDINLKISGADETTIRPKFVINAAGLEATEVARAILDGVTDQIPRRYFAKGSYFSLFGKAPFHRLIYPVPEPGGLGIHLTLDLAGQARFGPDVEWVERLDYNLDESRSENFYLAIRKYWPNLPDGYLLPAYTGIRPKIAGEGVGDADFLIQGEQEHGVPGLINLFGIESPGLTSCLAIADHVVDKLLNRN